MKLKRVALFATMIVLVATYAFAQPELKVGVLQMSVDEGGAPLGQLDLTNAAGIIQGVQTSLQGTGPWTPDPPLTGADGYYPNMMVYLTAGFNGFGWDGTVGITSENAKNDPNYYTTVGILTGDEAAYYVGLGTYAEEEPYDFTRNFYGSDYADGDYLLRYTYYGDSDFDGMVTDGDYGYINSAYANWGTPEQVCSWMWGDFDMDGAITDGDYGYINPVYGDSGGMPYGPLGSPIIGALGASSNNLVVPEPSTFILLASTLACALFTYSRKRS